MAAAHFPELAAKTLLSLLAEETHGLDLEVRQTLSTALRLRLSLQNDVHSSPHCAASSLAASPPSAPGRGVESTAELWRTVRDASRSTSDRQAALVSLKSALEELERKSLEEGSASKKGEESAAVSTKLQRKSTLRFVGLDSTVDDFRNGSGASEEQSRARARLKRAMKAVRTGVAISELWRSRTERALEDKNDPMDATIAEHLSGCAGSGHASLVFLGGSCNPTTWRHDIAMPYLREHGVDFYNPQVEEWSEDLIKLESEAKARASVLFFVIDNSTRAIVSMNEATEYMASGRRIVLVVQMLEDGTLVDGEPIAGRQLKDLNRGRAYLCEMAERFGCEVFNTVKSAMPSVVEHARQGDLHDALG